MAAAVDRDVIEDVLVRKLDAKLNKKDHRYYEVYVQGRRIARTMVSTGTGSKTIGANLVSQIARQLGVSTPFFMELVGCTKQMDDYLAHRRQNGTL